MKKAHRRVCLLSVYCVCFVYVSVALANPRLDRIQKTYIDEVDSFVSKEITSLLNTSEEIVQKQVNIDLLDLKEQLLKIEQALLELKTLSTPSNFQTALIEKKRLRGLLDLIKDTEKNGRNVHARITQSLSAFGIEGLCNVSIEVIRIVSAPRYALDETIDLSHIPEFRPRRVRASIGSEIESADTIEKDLYLPATTGGCIAGQAILFFLPVIGCIIGAVFGGGGAYAAGKISTAIITESENRNEHSAYEQMAAKERARQEQEIAEARLWMMEHPITESVIIERASKYCSKQQIVSNENATQEAEKSLIKMMTARIEAEEYTRDFEAYQNRLRTQALRQSERENSLLVAGLFSKLSFVNGAKDKLHELKVALAECLVDASDSCGSMVGCVNEVQNEYDNVPKDLKETGAASLYAELRKLQAELLLCKDD